MQWYCKAFAVIVVSALTACAHTMELPKDAAFDPNNPSGKAIVIAGFAAARYGTLFGITARGSLGDISLGWVKTTYTGALPAPINERMTLTRRLCQSPLAVLSDSAPCDQRVMQHAVFAATPGDYRLAGFGEIQYRGTLISIDTQLFKGPSLVFHVNAGDIVYIGDFVIDALVRPVKLVSFTRDDVGARAVLAEYKNVKGDIVFRAPNFEGKGLLAVGVAPPSIDTPR